MSILVTSTIAAISTAQSERGSGLGVIRLSGFDSIKIAEKVFKPANREKKLSSLEGYTALYGHIFDGDETVDECVALVFKAPHSYTGENVVELSAHGGQYILTKILRIVYKNGARPADAGEFTKRAFLNGKLDLSKAESIMDLISARGELAARAAVSNRKGAVFNKTEEIKAKLLYLSAQFLAFIDYPDDDILELDASEIMEIVSTCKDELCTLLSTYDKGKIIRDGIETAIVGSPNVGKSTLMNVLSKTERSIVADTAGTTRDVIEETVLVGDVILKLADTAGIRESSDVVEKIGVERSRQAIEKSQLILVVFDASKPLAEDDYSLIDELKKTASITTIAVLNKTDLDVIINKEYICDRFIHVVEVSAGLNQNIGALEEKIKEITGLAKLRSDEPILANERQRFCVFEADKCLGDALAGLEAGMTFDAVSVCVDSALLSLLSLTGERVSEAVVDEIFDKFCVGK